MKRDVTFESEGLKCAGWFFLPEASAHVSRVPAVVMAHGFSGVKQMHLARFAQAFAAAGLAALVFDYRYWGESEGEPRGRLYPYEQCEDYRNAITWLGEQPEVDPEQIGIWGTSYSGGHVLQVAAFDRRVKCVVSQVPAVDTWRNLRRLRSPLEVGQLISALAAHRRERYVTGAQQFLNVVAPAGEPSALGSADYEFLTGVAREMAPSWLNQITLDSMERIVEYRPGLSIDLVSPTPLLMIVAPNDALTPADIALEAFERARQPKELLLLRCRDHHDVYHQEPAFTAATEAAAAWFRRHLA